MYTREEAAAAVEQMLHDLEHNRHDTSLGVWQVLAAGPADMNLGRAITDAVLDVAARLDAGDRSPDLIRRARLLRVLAGEDPVETLDG